MAIDKAPAYQMYARDWLGSRSVRLMEDFQRGWYIQLLNEAWDNDPQGMLPNDPALLMHLAGVTEERKAEPRFNRCWAAVAERFKIDGAWVYNERQLEQVVSQTAYRAKQSEKGKKSAEKRAAMKALLQIANNGSTVVDLRLQPEVNRPSTGSQPEVNPPTPTPSPSASPEKKTTRPRADAALYRWDEFAAIYPGYRLHPDKAAKAWWAKNAKTDEVVDRILESVRGWLKSIQWEDGIVPNCSKFLDEGIWKGAPGPAKAEAKGWFD